MLRLLRQGLYNLNNSKFFAGVVMIMLNIGSKYITIKLSKSQEQYLRNTVARQLLIFSIIWMGTKDILISLAMTAAFIVLTEHLFNEESKYCLIPKTLRNYENLLDTDQDGYVTPQEVEDAMRVLEKMKGREKRRSHLKMLGTFRQHAI